MVIVFMVEFVKLGIIIFNLKKVCNYNVYNFNYLFSFCRYILHEKNLPTNIFLIHSLKQFIQAIYIIFSFDSLISGNMECD